MAENLQSTILIDNVEYNVHAKTAEKADDADKLGGTTAGSYALKSDLNYNNLTNKPAINNAKLTIQKNGAEVATFTANSASDVVANISVPTITDSLSSDEGETAALSARQGKILNDTKQDKLDNTNLKTINGESLLGSGDITITSGGGYSDVASKIKVTMNNNTADATITIKSEDPSGGNTGDIWFKY